MDADPEQTIRQVIHEQGARYHAFLLNFSEGFKETQLEMPKWILFAIISAPIEKLESGLTYREIKNCLQENHPEKKNLNPGNITQALVSVPALQSKKNIKPFILDYDRTGLRLSVVDKGFLIWLSVQNIDEICESIGIQKSDSGV